MIILIYPLAFVPLGVVEVLSPFAVEVIAGAGTSVLAFLADPGDVFVMTASAMRCVMWC